MISLSLESLPVVTSIQNVCYLYEENKSGSSVNKLQYRMFTEKNLRGDHLPSPLDVSERTSSAQSIDIFSELFYFIYQNYKI